MTRRVQLDALSIRDFRNIEAADIRPLAGFNVISGRNGMGKTNLLEAIYLLGAMRSFRTSTRSELLRHGSGAARVDGVFGGAAEGLRCEVVLGRSERRIRVNGLSPGKLADHFGELPMVLFHPDHVGLVRGAPEGRRRFLDRALFQASRSYPTLHRDYGRALASRNRLLRENAADSRLLGVFERQLATSGARLIEERRAFVESLGHLFESAVRHISLERGATVSYRPGLEGTADDLAAGWERSRKRDLLMGHTVAGPHSDDLVFTIDDRAARRFGSQGQQRTLALALKIAETRALEQATGRTPLLLLDDVSSELDRERNKRLFEFLVGSEGQVFITSTHEDFILVREPRLDFVVEDGGIKTA